jgi:TIR domain
MMESKYDIFISYSHKDNRFVKPIVQLLSLDGRQVFWDTVSISPRERWKEKLQEAIRESKVIVLLWRCHSSESKEVAHEIGLALKEDKKLAPVLLCSSRMPEPVGHYQWIDLSTLISHECMAHQGHDSLPVKQLEFRSILKRELGSELLQPHAIDEAWKRVAPPLPMRLKAKFIISFLLGLLLFASSFLDSLPSPFGEYWTDFIKAIGMLVGILLTLNGWLGIIIGPGYTRSASLNREGKLVALTIYSIVAQLERGEVDIRPRGLRG